MGENKIRNDELFQALTNTEIKTAIEQAIQLQILLIGKCEDGTLVVIKPQQDNSSISEIKGLLKSSSRIKTPQNAIFSFTVEENKFLFNANLNVFPNKTVSIHPLSRVYSIQRRANDRLIIPENYYALFKFTHINSKYVRAFGKVKDLSIGGIAIVLRNDDPALKVGDVIKGSLVLTGQPPEDVEMKIKHIRNGQDGTTALQIFGGVFHPEGSLLHVRRITIIISDIYNDIFKSTKL